VFNLPTILLVVGGVVAAIVAIPWLLRGSITPAAPAQSTPTTPFAPIAPHPKVPTTQQSIDALLTVKSRLQATGADTETVKQLMLFLPQLVEDPVE